VLNINEKVLAGTKHPINYYVLPEAHPLATGDFIYNLRNDRWIDPPRRIIENIDYASVMTLAVSECRACDGDIDQLRRDVIDHRLLRHDLENVYGLVLPKKEIGEMIRKKQVQIFADLDNLKKRYIQLHAYRGMAFTGEDPQRYLTRVRVDKQDNNYTINNIIWKHLERYGYLEQLKMAKVVHTAIYNSPSQELTPEIENDLYRLFDITDEA
jgi:hypothetical protein